MVRLGAGRLLVPRLHVLFFLDLYLSEEDESQFHPPPPFGLTELDPEVVVPQPRTEKTNCSATSITAAKNWTP